MHIIILITSLFLLGATQAYAAPESLSTTAQVTRNQSSYFLKTANSKQAQNRPVRGMSMRKVERLYGEPKEKMLPTGKPPITRWVYEQFTVYFEGKYVIHAVKNRQLEQVSTAR